MDITNFIIMTAAVSPDPRFGSAIANPAERLGQYRMAVRYWDAVAARAGFQVALVETSGSDALANDVRLIAFEATEAQIARGKGAVESAALDHALSILAPAAEATIAKVTGRLVVENAARLLNPVASNVANVRRTLDRRYCDSRFFTTTAGFWDTHLAGMGGDVDDLAGRYLEHSLAHRLIRAEFLAGASVEPFPVRPLVVGMSGLSGARYGTQLERMSAPLLGPAERALRRFANKQL